MPALLTDWRCLLALTYVVVAGATASAAGPEHAIVPGYERVFSGDDVDAVAAGRILLTELNCVSCHKVEDSLAAELKPKRGPVLSDVGTRVRPEWLVDFLSAPHTTKSGTSMPDLLASDDEAERKHNALAIAHFLASTGSAADSMGDGAAVARGRQLFGQIGCLACHDPQSDDAKPVAGSVPLGELEKKYTISGLASFLKDPLKARPGGRMPAFNFSDQQARDIACYFLRNVKIASNLNYAYYEGNWQNLPDFSKLEPKTTGKSNGPDVGVRERNDQFGLVFTGFLQIPKDGNYLFRLGSDDGSRLVIDGKELIKNDGIHPHSYKEARVELKQGPHSLRVEYFEGGGQESLTLEVEGPGLPRQPVAAIATPERERPKPAEGEEPFSLDEDLAALGQTLFTKRGCAACHEMKVGNEPVGNGLPAKSLAALQNTTRGCLAAKPPAGVPSYQLSDRQRSHLVAAIQSLQEPDAPRDVSPKARIHETFARFNCYGCHQRNQGPTTAADIPKEQLADLEPEEILALLKRSKLGGPTESRNAFFLSTMKEMGDEGRIPPPLDGVGDKLNEAYLKGILDNGADDRPYMLTAMPKFGGVNVGHLLGDLRAADLKTGAKIAEIDLPTTKQKAIGRRLAGAKGLGCIKCHTFGPHKATGIQSMDLQKMSQRLREDWFHRYMANPQNFRPGTRMPAPWPFGQASIRDVLDGSADQQMQSVWQYLTDGTKAGLPVGLTSGAIVLTPEDEPIIYRNFIEGVSPRGIAVGYPEAVNLCFDAEQMSLALIWENEFIDAGKHWKGRGQGNQRPLGDNVLSLVRGAPFAVLEDQNASWPTTTPMEAGYRFRGYRFNSQRQPVFLYSVGDASVSDEIVPQKNERGLAEFSRTLTIQADGAAGPMTYRAAVGNTIEEKDGWYVVDEHLQIKLSGDGVVPILRNAGGKPELRAYFDLSNGPIEIHHRYAW